MRYNHFDLLPERAFRKVGGRITLEGGGSGGGGQQTSTAYQTNIPEYLRGPAERMVSRGETISEQGYQPYTGERIAGFSPAQQAAFSEIGGLTTPTQFAMGTQSVQGAQQYGALGANRAMEFDPAQFRYFQMNQPRDISARDVTGTSYKALGVDAAPDVTGTGYTAERAAYTPEWSDRAATQYMNPYTQAVTDIAKREAVSDAAKLNQQLASQAAKAGAFGGSRFGIEQALLGSRLATNLSDIQTKGLESAYNQGLSQFNLEQAQRQAINLANQGAGNQAGQFTAAQAQQANLANQQVRQQANLASQAAFNEALKFGASQDQAAQIANQVASLTAAQANQNIAYQTGAQNLQANLTVQQQQEAARQNAANINLQGAQLGAQTGLQAASALQGLGTASQGADLQRLAAQQSAGAQQQALEQQKLDAAYQQAIEQRDWEKNQLGWLSGLIRGTPYSTSQLQTTSAPGASTASQLASLGLGAYGLSSLLGKKDGGAIKMAEGGGVKGYAPGGEIDSRVTSVPDQVIDAVVAGRSNALPVDVALQEQKRRKMLRTGFAGKQALEEIARASEQEAGLGALPAENMEFADGGIVGYAAGGLPQGYDPAIYEMFEDPTSGEVYPRKKMSGAYAYGQSLKALAQGKPSPAPVAAAAVEAPAASANKATDKDKASNKSDKTPARPPKTPAPAAAAPAAAAAAEDGGLGFYQKAYRDRLMKEDTTGEELAKQLDRQQENIAGMRGDIKAIAALRAAAAIGQGGPGGTLGQLSRGLGAYGEEAGRGINQIQAAEQALLGQNVQLAKLREDAENRRLQALAEGEKIGYLGPLYGAQTKQALANAAFLGRRDGGGGGGGALAGSKLALQALGKEQSNLMAQIKASIDPIEKATLQQRLNDVNARIANFSGSGVNYSGGDVQGFVVPSQGAVIR